jgi:hypothetical protein
MSSNDHTRKVVQDLLAELSPIEIRELCIDALKSFHRSSPDVRNLDVRSHLGRILLPLLAARKDTTVNVNDPRGSPSEIFLENQGYAWMDGFVEFLGWFVRAGFALPSTMGPNILTLRLTDYGRRFLEIEEDHPLLPGFVERVVLRCPNLPDEVAALLADARVCLDHMLMRPAIAVMGVAYETAIEAVAEVLVQRELLAPGVLDQSAARRIASIRAVVDTVMSGATNEERDNRFAARRALDFCDDLRRRRNDASHTKPTYGFDDREETEEFLVSAGRHLPNLWRLRI